MINELKSYGWDVDVLHERRYNYTQKLNGVKRVIHSRGGRTTVIVTKHNKAYSGTAICSDHDNYCKETGRKIALARALVQIPEFQSKVPNLFL